MPPPAPLFPGHRLRLFSPRLRLFSPGVVVSLHEFPWDEPGIGSETLSSVDLHGARWLGFGSPPPARLFILARFPECKAVAGLRATPVSFSVLATSSVPAAA